MDEATSAWGLSEGPMCQREFAYGLLTSTVPHSATADGPNGVIDGDTIMIGGERWRLFGWDAPPLSGCCPEETAKGQSAKAYLEQLICWGASQGTLKIQVRAITEKYHRKLVTITVNGENVGALMAQYGLADRYDGRGVKPMFCSCPEKRAVHEAEIALQESKKAAAFHRRHRRHSEQT